ncbi:hypothetical protein [Streptomyces sp. NPDC086010]|uniref:hypothetical protein n=1 Tax=Streptomyces sp. NPDC086010 TaxID=3365745 RepID=UPI0037D1F36E
MALRDGLDVPDTDGSTMAERVLARIVAEAVPVPVRRAVGRRERAWAWLRRRVRMVAAACAGLLVVLALTPPVRGAVVDWFSLGGVQVRYAPGEPQSGRAAEAPGGGAERSVASVPEGGGWSVPSVPEPVRQADFAHPGLDAAPPAVRSSERRAPPELADG